MWKDEYQRPRTRWADRSGSDFGSARSDYGDRAYGGRLNREGLERGPNRSGERGLMERASDEISSWFGDEEAGQRRRQDERSDRRQDESYSPERFQQERAYEVMSTHVPTVYADDLVVRAARLMGEHDCGSLPVVNDQGRLVGMVTDRDITIRSTARGLDPRRATVGDCMTDEAYACHVDDPLTDCLRSMSHHQVRRIPVVDDRHRVVGIISQGDLARHAAGHHGRGERRAMADVLSTVSAPTHSSRR